MALRRSYIDPYTVFSPMVSFQVIVMASLEAWRVSGVRCWVQSFSPWSRRCSGPSTHTTTLIMLGVIMIVVVKFLPQGLFTPFEEWNGTKGKGKKMSFLEITGVSQWFGGVTAVQKVNFSVGKGEIVGLIGSNGAGKTTLFNIIGGYYRPSEGNRPVQREDITERSLTRLSEGNSANLPGGATLTHMTVLRNVMVGHLFGKDCMKAGSQAEQEASRILEFVGLAAKRDYPRESLPLWIIRGLRWPGRWPAIRSCSSWMRSLPA